MPPRKEKPNPKAVAAIERQVSVLREKKAAEARATEDAKWVDEGSTLKERRAAEKANKLREKSDQHARKKALLAESDAADANDEAALQGRFKQVRVTRHEASTQRELENAARRAVQEAELNARLNKMLAPVAGPGGRRARGAATGSATAEEEDFGLPSNPNQERAGHMARDAVRLGGTDNVVEASGIEGALKALDFRTASLAGAADKHPEKRRKAAFKAYEARMMKEVREDYPDLKFSQVKQKVFELWKDAPENPMNQRADE